MHKYAKKRMNMLDIDASYTNKGRAYTAKLEGTFLLEDVLKFTKYIGC